MDNLAIKEVDFNGDTLIAAQDKTTEKVYVGVRWVVDGIGFTRGQANNQLEKIKDDLVLKRGVRNLVFQNMEGKGSTQEVLCIELDLLPLWLAKISITPKMVENSPDTVEKLISYQLKAKDVLANAFIHNVKQIIPQTYKEALLALVESIEEKERLEEENKLLLPKAESFDTFIDGSNLQKMNDVAKSLGYGRNKLFEYLRAKKILMKDNLPYQKYITNGYFQVKETSIKKGVFVVNKSQTFVTSKGVDYINKLMNEDGIERVI
ncbi:phage antirepressor KilAC domain-containing protein [Niallia alba]|uniref:phage antirepressor KilAC domain-containing protein n=1 Tax=Niallia alba TaxID=2729105 RepID=UPI002E248F93|nr:phage antirepressor KilAC domain-containing protein [Niallia alba]